MFVERVFCVVFYFDAVRTRWRETVYPLRLKAWTKGVLFRFK